ncbi:hypothetical protein ACHAXA_002729 [Cyclostephanos tholiformis]|uniref:Uncharacterized protein n=1 Tax=Cyclostephanos tholiformis TaxID=382380 RepID=A0ABD3RIW8_9STRA
MEQQALPSLRLHATQQAGMPPTPTSLRPFSSPSTAVATPALAGVLRPAAAPQASSGQAVPSPPINIATAEGGKNAPHPSKSSVVVPTPSVQCRSHQMDLNAHPRLAAHSPQLSQAAAPENNVTARGPRTGSNNDSNQSSSSSILSSCSSHNNNNNNKASSSVHSSSTVSTLHPSSSGLVENTGRWTAEEHRLFLRGLEQHGKGWKKIATLIQSRTVVQIRTHAQKYFQKLAKAHLQNGESGMGLVMVNTIGGGSEGGMGMATGDEGALCAPQGVGGGVVSVMGMAEGDGTTGIAIPLGPDGQPVVMMRTINVPPRSVHANNHLFPTGTPSAACGNIIGIGANSASSWAIGSVGAAMASSRGGGKKRRVPPKGGGGGTKRRVIGNIVRSAVREGRNVKRQKTAEAIRKCGGTAAMPCQEPSLPSDGGQPSTAKSFSNPPMTFLEENQGSVDVLPNPLPSVSQVLDPYVIVTHPLPPLATPVLDPCGIGGGGRVTTNGRGRKQIVHTATHGSLPLAALEDAVFRLLTPATGAPVLPGKKQSSQHHSNNNAIVDPLVPRVLMMHTHYTAHQPPGHIPPGTFSAGYSPELVLSNLSPTGVADMSPLLPSWVDTNNPPSWYNEGSDIDTLLDDADCLNWLSDTGNIDETYPPAVAEPAAVVSSSSAAANISNGGGVAEGSNGGYDVERVMIVSTNIISVQDPTGGVFHPSTESLSFLVDPPELSHRSRQPSAVMTHVEDIDHLPTFLEEESLGEPVSVLAVPLNTIPSPDATRLLYASATEAVEATSNTIDNATALATAIIPEHKLSGVSGESDNNLMGFPDLDMGDEQAFFSALLEN